MFKLASVTSKEIPEEFNMFGELFTLYKKYYHPEVEQTWWNSLMKEFKGLNKKYDTKLCTDLCLACIDAIESRYKTFQ